MATLIEAGKGRERQAREVSRTKNSDAAEPETIEVDTVKDPYAFRQSLGGRHQRMVKKVTEAGGR